KNTRLANTVSGYADKFVQKFGLNLQSTTSFQLSGLSRDYYPFSTFSGTNLDTLLTSFTSGYGYAIISIVSAII
ncbi:hypothetical protein PBR71_11815, partial [Levilactobacillus brevis]|uniref:hypothetical protein n=1 Tax=Levilactobacillus brevis TaxID=1580 RepID=UPI0022DD0B60